jgi:hypothetical protein
MNQSNYRNNTISNRYMLDYEYRLSGHPTNPSTGEHELHKSTCPLITQYGVDWWNKLLPIGSFKYDSDALDTAKHLYPSLYIDGCKRCCPSIHTK